MSAPLHREGQPVPTLSYLQAPLLTPRRRRVVRLDVIGAFVAGFAVALLLVAFVR